MDTKVVIYFFDCFHIARCTCSRSCHFPPLICESQRSPSLPLFSRLVNPMAYPTRLTPPTCSHLCLPRYFLQFLPSHSFAVSLVWLDTSPLGILINSGIVLVSFHLLWPESRDTCTFGSSLGFTPVRVVPYSQSSRLGFVRNWSVCTVHPNSSSGSQIASLPFYAIFTHISDPDPMVISVKHFFFLNN